MNSMFDNTDGHRLYEISMECDSQLEKIEKKTVK